MDCSGHLFYQGPAVGPVEGGGVVYHLLGWCGWIGLVRQRGCVGWGWLCIVVQGQGCSAHAGGAEPTGPQKLRRPVVYHMVWGPRACICLPYGGGRSLQRMFVLHGKGGAGGALSLCNRPARTTTASRTCCTNTS